MSGHHPFLYWTARHGSWATCICGWSSQTWTAITGAHLEFGQHLLKEERNKEMIENKIRKVLDNGSVAMNMLQNPDTTEDTFVGTEELMIAWKQLSLAVQYLLGDIPTPDLDAVQPQRAAFYTSVFTLDS